MTKEEVLLVEEVGKLLEDTDNDSLSSLRKAYSEVKKKKKKKKKASELDKLVAHWKSIRPVPETMELEDYTLDGTCPLCGAVKIYNREDFLWML